MDPKIMQKYLDQRTQEQIDAEKIAEDILGQHYDRAKSIVFLKWLAKQ